MQPYAIPSSRSLAWSLPSTMGRRAPRKASSSPAGQGTSAMTGMPSQLSGVGVTYKENKNLLEVPNWNPICSWWYHYHTYEDPIDISPWWCTYPSGARPSGEARQDCFPSDPEISFVPMVGISMIKVSQLLFRFMEFLVTATGQM